MSQVNNAFIKLDYRIGIRYILKEKEKALDRLFWERWLMEYPYMQKKISFEDFKEMFKQVKKLNHNEKADIDREVELINNAKRKKVSK